jgi:hypothetical protein
MTESRPERDALDAAAEDLERAESAGDDERLSVLEAVHARLADELDRPAGDPPTG